MRTREQQYAASIHRQVLDIKNNRALGKNENEIKRRRKEYGVMAHKLPVLVRTAGLVQALAFAATRRSPTQRQLLDDLAAIVLPAGNGLSDSEALLKAAQTKELLAYMRLSQKVMDALLWYKRYAQTELGVEQGDEVEESDAGEDDDPNASAVSSAAPEAAGGAP